MSKSQVFPKLIPLGENGKNKGENITSKNFITQP